MVASVLDGIAMSLIHNELLTALGVFGSVESGSAWSRSDIDLLLLTNEPRDRREVIYDRVNGHLIHYQTLSLLAWNDILDSYDNPMFAPLAETRILFDKTGDLRQGIIKAQGFPSGMRGMWACRELTTAIAHLHYGEKYLHLGHQSDAYTNILIGLGSLATMELYQRGIYAPREVWSHPEARHTRAARLMELCDMADLATVAGAAWGFIREQFESGLSPLLEYIKAHSPTSFFELLQAPELRRMNISERLVQEMLESGLIREEQSVYTALRIPELKYYFVQA